MKPSGLISYPCWSGECNVVLSGLSAASHKNDVFSPDKIYKTPYKETLYCTDKACSGQMSDI